MPSAACTEFLTDDNHPQPLWQPPPTACLPAPGAASEVLSLLMHSPPPLCNPPRGGGGSRQPSLGRFLGRNFAPSPSSPSPCRCGLGTRDSTLCQCLTMGHPSNVVSCGLCVLLVDGDGHGGMEQLLGSGSCPLATRDALKGGGYTHTHTHTHTHANTPDSGHRAVTLSILRCPWHAHTGKQAPSQSKKARMCCAPPMGNSW